MRRLIPTLLLAAMPTLALATEMTHHEMPPPAAATPAAGIQVQSAWARPTPPDAKMGVVYFMLTNKSAAADTLTGASTPVAASATLHVSAMDGGISKMRDLPSVAVKPGTDVTFQPGGMHVMLEGLKQALTAGQSFPLTLHFEKAGDVTTTVSVSKTAPDQGDMAGMKM